MLNQNVLIGCMIVVSLHSKAYLLYQLNIVRPPVPVPNKSCQVYTTEAGVVSTNNSFKILSKTFIVCLKPCMYVSCKSTAIHQKRQ